MPATKTPKSLLTSRPLGAGASVDTIEWDLRSAYGGVATVRLSNGSPAPTTPPVVKFYIGEATGVKRLFYPAAGDTVANSSSDIICEIPAGVMFVNITITGGATNGGSVEVSAQELTAI